ncbi:hypothetical protein N1I02_001155 [Serratia marcescens]
MEKATFMLGGSSIFKFVRITRGKMHPTSADFFIGEFLAYSLRLRREEKMTVKISKRDERFAKLVAVGGDCPGACYAKSRDREYKGINDDYQAERIAKNEAIAKIIQSHKRQLIARDVVSRQEALIDLTEMFRAPSAPEIYLELKKLDELRLEPEVYKARMRQLNTKAIKDIRPSKHGTIVIGYDRGALASRIMNLSGVDVTKPITEEGKAIARKTLEQIFQEMEGDN